MESIGALSNGQLGHSYIVTTLSLSIQSVALFVDIALCGSTQGSESLVVYTELRVGVAVFLYVYLHRAGIPY